MCKLKEAQIPSRWAVKRNFWHSKLKLYTVPTLKHTIIWLKSLFQSDGNSDEAKREQMEKLVREELERWDSETSIGQASPRGASPSVSNSSGRGGARARSSSRPGSGQHHVSR